MTHIKNDKYEIHFNGVYFIAKAKEHEKDGFKTAYDAIYYIENYILSDI